MTDPFGNQNFVNKSYFNITIVALAIERPGLKSRHSRVRLFFHRMISNSSNLNYQLGLVYTVRNFYIKLFFSVTPVI